MKTELVYSWMSPDPITVSPDTPLIDAHSMMQDYEIRRLPVVDKNGDLVGIITLGDIREASPSDASSLDVWELNYLLAKLPIERVMTRNPVTVYTTDTVSRAARLMLEHKISGLPVINPTDGTLRGVITESDIFRLVVQNWSDTQPKTLDLAGQYER